VKAELMPTISIIVTCYNIDDYVAQCLDSVLAQTVADLEVIVVDDGSTDRTPDIIRSYAQQDDRVVPLLLQENSIGGVATAANAGLDRASGSWVGFMDGDDFCEPHMFQRLLDVALACDSDLAMCRYEELETSTGLLREPADEHRWIELDRDCFQLSADEKKRFLQFVAVPWRKLYRRDLLESNGIRFPVGDYFYEDNPFHWFSVLSARSMAVVPEVLCYHRVARGGQTMQTVDERLFKMFDHHATIHDWIATHSYAAEFNSALLGWVISQLEWIGPRTPKQLRRSLFNRLVPIVAQYDERTVREALRQGQKGVRAASLVQALRQDNFATFMRAIDAEPTWASPLASAQYHLRYSGLRKTAQLTTKYAREKAQMARHRYRQRKVVQTVPVEELFFTLTVLDRRLSRIEDELRRVSSLPPAHLPGQAGEETSRRP
jgi:glycosyltransferase involved in cell wall biosynthesis